jgi:hypothetical protein
MPKRLNIKDMLAAGVIEPGPVIVKYCKLELRGILHKNGVFSQSINIRATARKKKVCMLPAFATASGFGLHMLRTVNPAVQTVNGYACIYYKGEKLGVIRDRLQAKNDAKSNSVINTVSTVSIDPKIKTSKACSKRKYVPALSEKMPALPVNIEVVTPLAPPVSAVGGGRATKKKRKLNRKKYKKTAAAKQSVLSKNKQKTAAERQTIYFGNLIQWMSKMGVSSLQLRSLEDLHVMDNSTL